MRARPIVVALILVTVLVGGAGRAARAERQLGVQVGGSGFFQGVARWGVHPALSVELGAMAITHALDLSAGVEVEPYRRGCLGVYASAGGAVAGAFGPVLVDPACTGDDCAVRPAGSMLAFGYLRAGVRWRFLDGTRAVAFNVGGWLGTWSDDSGPRSTDGWFLAGPVAGVSYLWLR